MKNGLWHKRIPTLPAFLVLFFSIFFTSYFLQQTAIFTGRASLDKTPQNVAISNITDSSFTVSFTSLNKAASALALETKGAGPQTLFDNRSANNHDATYYSHFITVGGLAPENKYSFTILSEGEVFKDNGASYNVTTGPKLISQNEKKYISGKVIMPDGTDAADTIVLVKIPGAQTISQITGLDGAYNIDTSIIRASSLKAFIATEPNAEIELKFLHQDLSSIIKSVYSASSSLPETTLSYKYDFTNIGEGPSATLSSALIMPEKTAENGEAKIINPVPGQSFVDDKPLFQGVAGPKQRVTITIESNPISATVVTDSNGVWSYRPDVSLDPGIHTITIQTVDSFGIFRTLTSSFTVYAQGSQIAGSGPTVTPTPRTSVSPTRSPTAAPTSAPTSTPKPSPTLIAQALTSTPIPAQSTNTPAPTQSQPTATLTPTPTLGAPTLTLTPSPTLVQKPTATEKPLPSPASPGSGSAAGLTLLSVGLILAGSLILFLL